MELNEYTHEFKVHVPNLLEETIMCGLKPRQKEALRIPLTLFKKYLVSVAERCIEINDPILNRLMTEMAIFSIGNPESEDYDPKKINHIIELAEKYQNK